VNWKELGPGAGRGFDILSRRSSVLALGAAALSAIAGPSPARAKKHGKKANKKCRRQANTCIAFVTDTCNRQASDPEECKGLFLPCCPPYATCDVATALACFFEAAQA
jgi:hypothetical protein